MIKYLPAICLFPFIAVAQQVDNFTYGLACTDAKTFGWICHETERIYVTGQGTCIAKEEEVPCTWHGFEFDYENFDEATELKCVVSSSIAGSVVDPDKQVATDVNQYSYVLPTLKGNGHFFNPQYIVLGIMDEKTTKHEHTTCYLNGTNVAEFSSEIIYPTTP